MRVGSGRTSWLRWPRLCVAEEHKLTRSAPRRLGIWHFERCPHRQEWLRSQDAPMDLSVPVGAPWSEENPTLASCGILDNPSATRGLCSRHAYESCRPPICRYRKEVQSRRKCAPRWIANQPGTLLPTTQGPNPGRLVPRHSRVEEPRLPWGVPFAGRRRRNPVLCRRRARERCCARNRLVQGVAHGDEDVRARCEI